MLNVGAENGGTGAGLLIKKWKSDSVTKPSEEAKGTTWIIFSGMRIDFFDCSGAQR